jgi:hypothetical protein
MFSLRAARLKWPFRGARNHASIEI